MKCPSCNKDIDETKEICPNCGYDRKNPTHITPYAYAFGILANQAQANQVSEGKTTLKDTRTACMDYLRSRKQDLFTDTVQTWIGSIPPQGTIHVTDLFPLDYEERIVVLMQQWEKREPSDIAKELNIPEENVRGYLKEAEEKMHPQKPEKPKKKAMEKPEPEKQFKWKNFLIVLAVVIIGTVIGLRIDAVQSYQKGIDALQNGQYEDAINEIEHANNLGYHKTDERKYLAQAYVGLNDKNQAVTLLEFYLAEAEDSEAEELLDALYHASADESISAGDYSAAAGILEKIYLRSHSYRTFVQWQACLQGGTFVDSYNITYDAYGNPVHFIAPWQDGYQIDAEYDDNNQWQMLAGYNVEGGLKTVFRPFAYTANTMYEVQWMPIESGSSGYQITKQEKDEDGNMIKETVITPDSKTIYTYSYTKDKDGNVTEMEKADSDGNVLLKETYSYRSGNLDSKATEANGTVTTTKYSYENNRLVKETENAGLFNQVKSVVYTYDDDGNLTEKVTDYGEYKWTKEYTYSEDGTLLMTEEKDEAGNILTAGYPVEGSGILYLNAVDLAHGFID